MSRSLLLAGALLALLLAVVAWQRADSRASNTVFLPKSAPPEAGALCPWRDPESDLKVFFPDGTRTEIERRILSGLRVELARRLGRTPSGDENALQVYRVYREQTPLGAILTSRVKGSHGAIEVVLAIDPAGKAQGLRLQRLREPAEIAAILESSSFLDFFRGRSAENLAPSAAGWPAIPPVAAPSAAAIHDAVRSLLTLYAASEEAGRRSVAAAAHH